MVRPRRVGDLRGLFPPASGADHVEPAVAVDVADAQAMRELLRAGDLLPGAGDRFAILHHRRDAWLADRVHGPRLGRILARFKPRHLPFVTLAFGLPAHDDDTLTVAEQVDVLRSLVAGAVPDFVLLPKSIAVLTGILIPGERLAREIDHDHVRVAVVIEVVYQEAKDMAVNVLFALRVIALPCAES